MANNYLDRHELLKEAIEANKRFKQWRIDNNIAPGQQYVKRIMRGAIPPPPQMTDELYLMLWRMGEGLLSSTSFGGYSPDWKYEMMTDLSEAIVHFSGKFDVDNPKYKSLTEDELAKGVFAFYTKCIQRTFYKAITLMKAKHGAETVLVDKANYDHWHTPHHKSVEDEMILREELLEAGLDEYGDKEGVVEVKQIKGIRKFRGNYCPECGGEVIGCSTRKKYCDDCVEKVQRRQNLQNQRAKRLTENVIRNCVICGKVLPLHKQKLCGDEECKRKQVNKVATTYRCLKRENLKNCLVCGREINGIMGRLYCDECKRKVRNRKNTIKIREKSKNKS